jgi:hypothetical protein
MSRRTLVKYCLVIAAISFCLNFIWEWVQCRPFFIHTRAPPTVMSMVEEALGDVVIMLIVLGIVRFIGSEAFRNWQHFMGLGMW